MDGKWRQVEAVGPTTADVPKLCGEDEGTTTSTAAKLRVAAVTASATVATPAVAFAPEKPKVGAAPNTGAGSPVSLAAILHKEDRMNSKSEVGAAPNMGAGSQVSLAAILYEIGLHKLGPV